MALERIEPFIPGMIATLDPSGVPGGASRPIFRRWYSRAFSHTVTRSGRSCVSCHNDPVALGYGEGRLEFVATGPAEGRWRFSPAHPSVGDGLPADVWIGFVQDPGASLSSRDDVRPLDVDEQHRVLAVGTCLTCHPAESAVMRRSLRGFETLLAERSPRCRVAAWRR